MEIHLVSKFNPSFILTYEPQKYTKLLADIQGRSTR